LISNQSEIIVILFMQRKSAFRHEPMVFYRVKPSGNVTFLSDGERPRLRLCVCKENQTLFTRDIDELSDNLSPPLIGKLSSRCYSAQLLLRQ
jgi:hypothetical protein